MTTRATYAYDLCIIQRVLIEKCMATNIPSPTRSTNKANSYLQTRRQGRRHQNASVDPLSEEKGGTESAVSTQEVAESPASPPDSSGERHQDQAEKAYKYLAQRRAKRRNRCLVSAQLENPESSPTATQNPPNLSAENMAEPQILIVLVSNGVSDRTQASNQSRARTLLQSKGTPHVEVDGMDPNQKERCVTLQWYNE